MLCEPLTLILWLSFNTANSKMTVLQRAKRVTCSSSNRCNTMAQYKWRQWAINMNCCASTLQQSTGGGGGVCHDSVSWEEGGKADTC